MTGAASRIVWPGLAALGGAWLLSIYLSGLWPVLPLDFSVFWAAGIRVLEGEALLIYDGATHNQLLGELYSTEAPGGLNFAYPPGVLLFIWPLGLLPSWAAWLVMLALPMLLFFAIVRRLCGGVIAVGMAFAIGGAIHSIQLGQNGFITAVLIGGGLLALKHNNLVAGLAIGLLSLKPHLAPVAFLALLYWREWKALIWASVTAALLILLPALIFGIEIWSAFLSGGTSFFDTISAKRETLIETMHQSVFALVLAYSNATIALIFQALVAIAAVLACSRIRERDLAIAAVIAATMLFTPFLFLYDSTMLLISCSILARRDQALSIPLAFLVATTGLWFFTLGSLVPFAALGVLVLCLTQDRASGEREGRRIAPTASNTQTA